MDQRPTAIDLFAGAGGASQGLTDAGLRVLAALELDAAAAATYALNHPRVALLQSDIRRVGARPLMRSLDLDPGDLDLLQACPPCPSWSTLGNTPADDERRDLIDDAFRFIRAFRPKAFILENVPGLAADPRLADRLSAMGRLGYRHRSYLVDATWFGVPQRRKRLIVIGAKAPAQVFPETIHPKVLTDGTLAVDAHAAIRHLADLTATEDPLHVHRTHTARVLRRLQAIPPGGDRHDLPDDLVLDCHRKLLKRNATASYGRVPLTGPSATLTTRCTTPACGSFVHPTLPRGLSLREAAILQTFPNGYQFSGTYGQIEKQIGNAIPVRLAQAAGAAALALVAAATGG